MTTVGARYSLLAVVGAGFFVSAPIATWMVVDSITSSAALDTTPVALDVPVSDVVAYADVAAVELPALDLRAPDDVNLHALLQEARVVPAFVGGRTVGFKLFGIRAGSDFARAGLQNGDVINRINGIELTSPSRALEAYNRANDGLVVVDFTRSGQRGTLTHHVPRASVPSTSSTSSTQP